MFALYLLNVITVFALIGALVAFVLVTGALMRLLGRRTLLLPLAVGVVAAWLRTGALSWRFLGDALLFTLAALAALSFLCGWLLQRQLDRHESSAGRPLLRPVLLAWAGCLAFALVVALVNQSRVGDARFWPAAARIEHS